MQLKVCATSKLILAETFLQYLRLKYKDERILLFQIFNRYLQCFMCMVLKDDTYVQNHFHHITFYSVFRM